MGRGWMAIAGGLILGLVGAFAWAQSDDVADGKALYLDNCSSCHGLIASQSSTPRSRRAATAVLAEVRLVHDPAEGSRRVSLGPGWSRPGGPQLAVAPPYGPTLRGVYGRPAGTVTGFLYSREFLKRLQGVIWTGETLDIWIRDSQGWVPGSMMFYQQPDPEIRRKIIAYLSTAR
jgi:cytochrome c2